MVKSLSLIFLVGLSLAAICQRLRLPRILGMLFTGVILGPFLLDILDPKILSVSLDLRQMALIIILIRAGLTLNIHELRKVGRPAVLMAFLPAVFEIAGVVVIAPLLLGVTILEAAIMGSVLAAVSPAVVVPKMVHLIETGYGTAKGIPQLILAGASLDDVFVIVLFSAFVNMGQGNAIQMIDFVNIPISIVFGIMMGVLFGWALSVFFETAFSQKRMIRNSTKVIIVLGTSFLMMAIEEWANPVIPISGLLAVMSMANALQIKSPGFVSKRMSDKFGKLWIAAEVILFVLVGASVDISYTLSAGFSALALVLIGLVFRSVGVLLCQIGTKLNLRERIFCVISYLPKATVQAAIGSVPLYLGMSCGKLVLSVAVVSIILTAPIGALGIEMSYKKLLTKEKMGGVMSAGNQSREKYLSMAGIKLSKEAVEG
ncbi:MAG: cation:proton antiporter [Christensenellales bacterium]|jgi:NhaP-type Na+/H+ or K+/H+ antiporter